MNISSIRTYLPDATTGIWTVADTTFYSIELPWRSNYPDLSCIPPGEYELRLYISPKHGKTFCFHNPVLGVWALPAMIPANIVGGRSLAEIHAANWADQLLGCTALGLAGQPMLNPEDGKVDPAVEESVDAIETFLNLVGWVDGHTINISCASGTTDPTDGYIFTGV
ncbi:MAG: DUF5675 family protein [Ktedonobacteraceae bacterium]